MVSQALLKISQFELGLELRLIQFGDFAQIQLRQRVRLVSTFTTQVVLKLQSESSRGVDQLVQFHSQLMNCWVIRLQVHPLDSLHLGLQLSLIRTNPSQLELERIVLHCRSF